jgi:hypothetical protein
MGQQGMDKPPTKAKPSAEPEDAPEQLDADIRRDVLRAAETCSERFEESPSHHAYKLAEILEALGRFPHLIDPVYAFMGSKKCPPKIPGVAPVVAIRGVPVRRLAMTKDPQTGEDVPVEDENGLLVYQRISKGRQWEGPYMVKVTRWAIEEYDADPLDVVAAVIRHLPPLLRADCRDANRDPDQVGLAKAIADLLADDGTGKTKQGWRDPAAVLRAILGELGHPRAYNVTRDRIT